MDRPYICLVSLPPFRRGAKLIGAPALSAFPQYQTPPPSHSAEIPHQQSWIVPVPARLEFKAIRRRRSETPKHELHFGVERLLQDLAARLFVGAQETYVRTNYPRRDKRRSMAQRIAFVEQHATTNASLKVIDVVKLGHFPHRSLFSGWTIAADTAVTYALERTEMASNRTDRWQSLSGGEKQRTHLSARWRNRPGSSSSTSRPTISISIIRST